MSGTERSVRAAVIAILLLGAAPWDALYAQRRATRAPVGGARTGSYSVGAPNLSADRLPPNYRGNDIVKVFDTLSAKQIDLKGEFETTEQFKARRKAAADAVVGNIYAFKVEFDKTITQSIRYDADKGYVEITVPTDTDGAIKIRNQYTTISSTGTNAFGAKTTILTVTGSDWLLTMSGRPPGLDLPVMKLAMAPEQARFVVPQLAVLVICSLRPDYNSRLVFTSPSLIEPTFSLPVGRNVNEKHIYVAVRAVWLYDVASGEILRKE